ncbi:NB-ARC domain-containing protein [Micromonospora sp. CA-244673]|uniref:NB-ARC domain-containing protein n=1 Tax=Micromonospora sp. CA-244673 TaxID=3239958 RepID=UPI003D89F9C9
MNHFYNIFEKFFPDLVDENLRPIGEALKPFKNSVLASLREIKAIRDPISHPPETDLSPYDALNVVHNAGRVLKALNLTGPMNRLESIQTELARRAASLDVTSYGSSPSLSCSLPPKEEMFDHFIGRTTELEELWRWLADPSAGRWVLVGEGGKGKSAIAYQFCNTVRHLASGNLVGIFWLSAKRRRYQEASVREINNPDFHDLDSALSKLLNDYGWSTEVSKSVDAKREQVLELMRSLPSLIVADDIDSIDPDCEDVVEFLTYDAPRTGSKILLTSRRQYAGMSRSSTKVSGLAGGDAEEFLRTMANRLALADAKLPARFESIIELTEGSPLYMEDLLRLCRRLPVDKAIERWRNESGDSARRYALQRERELLSPLAQEVLDACCLARVELSVAQLERILNKSEALIFGALDELEKSYLVPGPVIIDDIPTFRVNRNLESLVRKDVRQDASRLALRNAVEAVVTPSRGSSSTRQVDGYVRQIRVLTSSRRPQEALNVADQALDAFPNNPHLLAAQALAFAAMSPSRDADARAAWSRAFQLGNSRKEVYLQWSWFEAEQQNWTQMSNAAQNGITRCGERHELLLQAGYAESRLGQAQDRALDGALAQQSFDRAANLLKRALRAAEQQGASDADKSRIYKALVVNGQSMHRNEEILYWMKQWLSWNPDDPYALDECRRQSKKFVELKAYVDVGPA